MMRKTLSLFAVLAATAAASLSAATLNQQQKAAVDAYMEVSDALVADDTSAVTDSAQDLANAADAADLPKLADAANELVAAHTIEEAREAFKAVSKQMVSLTEGTPGYVVMTCPMAKADWVQKDKKVSNPYMGQKMSGCGMEKKASKRDMHHDKGEMKKDAHAKAHQEPAGQKQMSCCAH